jgi:hypothetical protein
MQFAVIFVLTTPDKFRQERSHSSKFHVIECSPFVLDFSISIQRVQTTLQVLIRLRTPAS